MNAGPVTRMAVLVSGGGTTLQNFIDRVRAGSLPVEIGLVLASKSSAFALERARTHDVPGAVVAWPGACRAAEFSDEITRRVEEAGCDLVCMGGFLRRWVFPDRWFGRVLNIHPGLLPFHGGKGMYGHHVHEAVLAAADPVSGCTVHFADLVYDGGPILLQREVPVLPGDTPDTLAARVFEAECEVYPEAVALLATGRVRLHGRDVTILPAA